MAKKYKAGSNLTKNELSEIRKISKLCCDNPNVIEYVINVCKLIVELVKEYAIYYKKDIDAVIYNKLHQDNKTSPGQVNTLNDVKSVIKEGNLRERMALIMNFGLRACEIVIWAIATKNHLLSAIFIKEQTKRLKNLTGLDVLDIHYMLEKCKNNCSKLEDTPCKFSLLNQDGSVILSRYTEFPILSSVRFKRPELVEVDKLRISLKNNPESKEQIEKQIEYLLDKNKKTYSMTIKDIYPPLSDREKQFININNISVYPPYLSGYMLFDTNKDNYYNILAENYKQSVIAGPSGSTDLFLITSKMFKIFNLDLGILACIAWMCNIPQHSIFEILMGSLPFGLNDWSPKINANEYVIKLNNKVQKKVNNYLLKSSKSFTTN